MRQFLRMIFTWWHSQTLGTALLIWWRGAFVGVDAQGNRYYQDKKGASVNGMHPRRWVVYNGDVDASRVPAEWHGWLHYTVEQSPAAAPEKNVAAPEKHAWQQPHQMNLTGTRAAYKPTPMDAAQNGTIENAGYESWRPK